MLIKKNYFLLVPLATVLILTSCGGDKAENLDETGNADSSKTTVMDVPPSSETFFQVPSPGEMLTFIKMVGGKNNKNVSFLSNPSNISSYADIKSKALNFGIYSCDLSYCSIFEIGAEALKYFKAVKQLGDQIGVSTAIQPEMMKRLESNLGNPDSLSVISDDIYFSSFETLESSKQGTTLALVVAGGWIESLFIATNLAKYEPNSPIVERLADQKYTLENLNSYLAKYETDSNVSSVITQFKELAAEFNKISEKKESATSKSKGNKIVLGGGNTLVLSKEQYQEIVNKIASVRNSFTQIK